MRLGLGTGSGRNSSASARLNIAELAPMPSASERTAMVVKPGVLCRIRSANWMSPSITGLLLKLAESATQLPAQGARQAKSLALGARSKLSETGMDSALFVQYWR